MSIGIYCIRNVITNKRYIGKSKNIEKRFRQHKYLLTSNKNTDKNTNRHLKSSVLKYGIENFEFSILETITTIDENLLSEMELKWIDYYKTLDRSKGYNLRYDSSTKMVCHEETLKMMSDSRKGKLNSNYGNKMSEESKHRISHIKKEQHSNGLIYGENWKNKISVKSKELWEDEDKKAKMAKKVSESKTIYKIIQYTKDMELVAEYDSVKQVVEKNIGYKWQNIYSVCNGYKKSYMGYIWVKQSKI